MPPLDGRRCDYRVFLYPRYSFPWSCWLSRGGSNERARPGSIGALSVGWADLPVCNWLRAVGDSFSHAGAGDPYADVASYIHCHPDSDRDTHPDRYSGPHAQASDRYVASRAHCHPGSNWNARPDRYSNSHARCHLDSLPSHTDPDA